MRPTKRGGGEKKRQNRHQTSIQGPGAEWGAKEIIAYVNKKGRSRSVSPDVGDAGSSKDKDGRYYFNCYYFFVIIFLSEENE